tara:strand:- start:1163 stop:1627 length:465 start_codon:yes stop_codon:yes gene_type:complete
MAYLRVRSSNHSLARFPLGNILQIQSKSSQTEATVENTNFEDITADWSLTITPSSTSNKIFIMWTYSAYNNTANQHYIHTLLRDSSNLGNSTFGFGSIHVASASNISPVVGQYLDSPSTTSAVTYKVQHRVTGGTGVAIVNSPVGSITVMEVAQ